MNGNEKNNEKTNEQKPKSPPTWFDFILNEKPNEEAIKQRLITEVGEITKRHESVLKDKCVLYIFDNNYDIDSFTSDRIYTSLSKQNKDKSKDVMLIIVSRGGRIEPAYQISKICKKFSNKKFIVTIPRHAKSAATLICLGSDEIHMDLLSELGPIDPQHFGLPVLGLKYSLEQIAEICEVHPKSAPMFSEYLQKSLYVPNIGYYKRLGESAVQYAERLLSNKTDILPKTPHDIADMLVNVFKDHGFVIDVDEAKQIFGGLIKTNSREIKICDELYQLLDLVEFLLGLQNKTLRVIGDITFGYIISLPKKKR